jgi:hypothetical protein
MNLQYIVAIVYILFGLVKVIVSLCIALIPLEKLQQNPIMSLLVKPTPDNTAAGKMYEYVILVFAIFSLLYGLAMFGNVLPLFINRILLWKRTELTVMIVLGLFLLLFYSLVLYTSVPISKKTENDDVYILFGIGSGLSFIILPLVWKAITYSIPFLRRDKYAQALGFLIIVVVVSLLVGFCAWYIKKLKKINHKN